MIHTKIKNFISKKKEDKEIINKEKETLIKSILDSAKGNEVKTFKKNELEKLSNEELKSLKKELEES